MNEIIETAIDTFKDFERFNKEYGKWIADNIGSIMEYLYNIPVGEQVDINKYFLEQYGDDLRSVTMGQLIPYLIGPYSVLDIAFETKDGRQVKVGPWELAGQIDRNKIKCVDEDGKVLEHNEVYIIFRRNDRMDLKKQKDRINI